MRRLFCGVLLFACLGARPAFADQFIWCVLVDDSNNNAYFSAAFPGDYSGHAHFAEGFTDFVQSHYAPVIGTATCTFRADADIARDSFNQEVADYRRSGFKKIELTNWNG